MLELLEIQNLNCKVMHNHIRHKNNRSIVMKWMVIIY